MTPHDLWQIGDTAAALAVAGERAETGDDRAKLLHFEIAAALGRTTIARAALRSIVRSDDDWLNSRRDFVRLLKACIHRRLCGYGFLFDAVPAHAGARRAALRAERRGDPDRARRLVDLADGGSPTIAGHVDGREFAELRDIDDGFASVLEVLAGSRALLIPWEQIRRVRLLPAEGLLDTVLCPAELRLSTGDDLACRLPLHYAGRRNLTRETNRRQRDNGPIRGTGARMLLTHDEEFLLSDCRQIDIMPVVVT